MAFTVRHLLLLHCLSAVGVLEAAEPSCQLAAGLPWPSLPHGPPASPVLTSQRAHQNGRNLAQTGNTILAWRAEPARRAGKRGQGLPLLTAASGRLGRQGPHPGLRAPSSPTHQVSLPQPSWQAQRAILRLNTVKRSLIFLNSKVGSSTLKSLKIRRRIRKTENTNEGFVLLMETNS